MMMATEARTMNALRDEEILNFSFQSETRPSTIT
jgi:hypothetical protein